LVVPVPSSESAMVAPVVRPELLLASIMDA
jgi:hypothetical protein